MIRTHAGLLASALLMGCEIDFVEIEESSTGHVSVQSEHTTAFETSLDIALPEQSGHPLARVGGVNLQWKEEDGVWRSHAVLAVDTLQPQIELVIQEREELVLVLPLVSRNGPAVWQQNGDLELPLVHGDFMGGWRVGWRVTLVDAGGRPLIHIDSPATPLPSPLVLRHELVPPEAVAAEFAAFLYRQFESEASYPLSSGISTMVRVPIPGED